MVSQDKTGKLADVNQDDLLNCYQGSDGGKAFNMSPKQRLPKCLGINRARAWKPMAQATRRRGGTWSCRR